MENEPL